MPFPDISVVVPVFNSENTMSQTIQSILNQSFQNFELIISDDGSTDNTRKIIEEYACKDKRIKKVYNDHTGCISKVINSGFKLANGKYYSTIDSDDMISKECFSQSYDYIVKNNTKGLIYTDHAIINDRNKLLGKGKRCNIDYSKNVLLLNFIVFHFRLFHRDLFYRVGGMDESLYRAVDYDFCLKVSEIAEIKHLKEILYFYRIHDRQVTKLNNPEQVKCTFKAINNALKRRRLDNRYNLVCKKQNINNNIVAKFILMKKGDIHIVL
jgi:glycosyltransferase involved in cell wall biosynthesis